MTVSSAASRWAGFGTTIFTEMSALAERTGAINLGQGFPDEDGPAEVLEAAQRAIRDGHNQYAPLPGRPRAARGDRRPPGALLRHRARPRTRRCRSPSAPPRRSPPRCSALCDPGDEVVVFEPYYDSYAAGIAMAGAVRRPVTLRPPDWPVDPDALAAAITPRARVLLLNTPHNPTGKVFSRAELELVAAAVPRARPDRDHRRGLRAPRLRRRARAARPRCRAWPSAR